MLLHEQLQLIIFLKDQHIQNFSEQIARALILLHLYELCNRIIRVIVSVLFLFQGVPLDTGSSKAITNNKLS